MSKPGMSLFKSYTLDFFGHFDRDDLVVWSKGCSSLLSDIFQQAAHRVHQEMLVQGERPWQAAHLVQSELGLEGSWNRQGQSRCERWPGLGATVLCMLI